MGLAVFDIPALGKVVTAVTSMTEERPDEARVAAEKRL